MSKVIYIIIAICSLLATDIEASQRQLRFLAYTLLDRPPTIEEAQAYYNGEITLTEQLVEWLESEDHETRVARFFNDMFGVRTDLIDISSGRRLRQNDSNIWYRKDETCAGQTPTTAEAWWLEPGETITVCPADVDSRFWIGPNSNGNFTACEPNSVRDATCGCGPKMIFCFPEFLDDGIMIKALQYEFRDRGLYSYKEDLSWTELFAGRWVYGDRYRAFGAFLADFFNVNLTLGEGETPSDVTDQIDALMQIPVDENARLDVSGTYRHRHGIATMGAVNIQNPTFRSMIREVVDKLLCQEIGPQLNTGNIDRFVNPDTIKEVEELEAQTQCANCHYVLDNMASTYANFFRTSYYGFAWGPMYDETGHVFGEDGEGPQFLIAQILAHDDFLPCMARRVWEDFSGTSFDTLSVTNQNSFINAASLGPKGLIKAVLQSQTLRGLR